MRTSGITMCGVEEHGNEIEDNALSIQGTAFEKLLIKRCHIILKNIKASYAYSKKDGMICFNKSHLKSNSQTCFHVST